MAYHQLKGSRTKNRKKRNCRYLLALFFVIGLAIAGWLIREWWLLRNAGFVTYPGFGIALPSGFDIHGIDVSHHQGLIRWDRVRAMKEKSVRLGFSFIKATEGITRVDPRFSRNWRNAKQSGMVRGAYHFFLANRDASKQAANFISTVKLEKGDLPPVLDVEETYGVDHAVLRKRVRQWLQEVERHYGEQPIIYTSADFYSRVLGSEFDAYPLWVAHYIRRREPRIGRTWQFWQYSETGQVNGVAAKVDFNVFNGDSSAFRLLLIK